MKISVLGSGSKGNCTLLETANTKILIDCGFSAKETVKRLAEVGVEASSINGIFLTHEHKDHTMGIENFASKFNVPVFAHSATLCEYERNLQKNVELNDIVTQDFYFRELTIAPFEVSHDSKHCSGFSVYCAGEKFSLATDLGFVDERILNALKESGTVVIESNHDPFLLQHNENYPQILKNRIAGRCGHLSNQECAKTVVELAKSGTKNFVLAHLSRENNTALKAKDVTMQSLFASGLEQNHDLKISVALQELVVKV